MNMEGVELEVTDDALRERIAAHLARGGGVGIRVREADLPSSPALKRYADITANSLRDLMLHGGEEYEVLFTAKAKKKERVRQLISRNLLDAAEIGEVYSGSGVMLEYRDGGETTLEPRGFAHFSV